MRTPLGAFIVVAIMLLMDTYIFQAIKTVSQHVSPKVKVIIYSIYWTLSAVAVVCFLLFLFTEQSFMGKRFRTYLFATFIGLFMAKLVAIVFFLIDDIRRLIQWVFGKITSTKTEVAELADGDGISRSTFLSWLGLAAGGTLFGSLLYGYSNKYNYHVKRIQLAYDNLPAAFKGLKIVHISDIHSGSFTDKKAVAHGVEKILNEKADLILFTGDLVNDRTSEMEEYMDVFNKLNAPLGVYSTLGNHDYGDYVRWPYNGITKEQNLESLKKVHADMGWKLLMNEHVVLEKGGAEIALLGIENWSNKARFPKHGRMDLAHAGADKYPFKILMSHDPSHWDAQVKPNYPDVDLTLSGHTHGMQFGIEIPGFKWSPVQYMYKQWHGLYEDGKQKLYVNPGYGFLGYPGRVGVLAEITVIELV
ncbi:MAG: metallophosphoesterase [Chitinophagaceae bacterium]|nr:metallophosphoesterase [Chitinophagaceae bacterium]MBK8788403.1 metallophosphoesterase [Chitinophagaceae bacterium]MBK9484756.1 metallophosphoesterase [Chitinophagaceae bacterium]